MVELDLFAFAEPMSPVRLRGSAVFAGRMRVDYSLFTDSSLPVLSGLYRAQLQAAHNARLLDNFLRSWDDNDSTIDCWLDAVENAPWDVGDNHFRVMLTAQDIAIKLLVPLHKRLRELYQQQGLSIL